MERMTDKEKLVRLTMMYAQDIKPWDLVVFYDMMLNFPEEIVYQWTAMYAYRDPVSVNIPAESPWKMTVQVTTIGEFAYQIFAYWYDQPSKEIYGPAKEFIDNWQKVCTSTAQRKFYAEGKK